ncbi:MAG: class I SAM-dependent methyltransferase [Candidatus Aminicenantia bacterium]
MVSCPLCKSKNIDFWKKGNIESVKVDEFRITDSDYGRHWDLFKCKNCEFIFSVPFPPIEINRIYREVEDPEYQEEEDGRSGNFRSILKVLSRIINVKGTLLDVGCATGIMMNLARKDGWEVYGVEPSLWAVNEAKIRYGLKVLQGSFLEIELPENFFSVITFIDIIEHVSSPKEFLLKAWKLLKKGGIFVVVTPDVKSLTAKIIGEKWWHFRPGHIGFFSKKTLIFLLTSTGFEVLKIKRYKWRFSLYYIWKRIKFLRWISDRKFLRSILKRIPLILPLMDSIEIYARKS